MEIKLPLIHYSQLKFISLPKGCKKVAQSFGKSRILVNSCSLSSTILIGVEIMTLVDLQFSRQLFGR